ncbi:rRNA-processing protein Fyv7/TAP26 [Kipferlia bialata]|uniref:rRNA-processing protein Fyv7/TAP26 n=1 Tax=Kipferlia bialata TaxID=797122 RepID=A0A9K3CXX9_9EUKA|nr:rRNA-processing protein Fyv7/TAP26 [Kipferlia bialata]|eukprot:g5097.t1
MGKGGSGPQGKKDGKLVRVAQVKGSQRIGLVAQDKRYRHVKSTKKADQKHRQTVADRRLKALKKHEDTSSYMDVVLNRRKRQGAGFVGPTLPSTGEMARGEAPAKQLDPILDAETRASMEAAQAVKRASIKEMNDKKSARKSKRSRVGKQMNRRTKRGQPVMAGLVQFYLDKLEGQ